MDSINSGQSIPPSPASSYVPNPSSNDLPTVEFIHSNASAEDQHLLQSLMATSLWESPVPPAFLDLLSSPLDTLNHETKLSILNFVTFTLDLEAEVKHEEDEQLQLRADIRASRDEMVNQVIKSKREAEARLLKLGNEGFNALRRIAAKYTTATPAQEDCRNRKGDEVEDEVEDDDSEIDQTPKTRPKHPIKITINTAPNPTKKTIWKKKLPPPKSSSLNKSCDNVCKTRKESFRSTLLQSARDVANAPSDSDDSDSDSDSDSDDDVEQDNDIKHDTDTAEYVETSRARKRRKTGKTAEEVGDLLMKRTRGGALV